MLNIIKAYLSLEMSAQDFASAVQTIALLTKAVTPLQQVYNRHRR